jgi:hypothetical protein
LRYFNVAPIKIANHNYIDLEIIQAKKKKQKALKIRIRNQFLSLPLSQVYMGVLLPSFLLLGQPGR